jgi:hypothetical protein
MDAVYRHEVANKGVVITMVWKMTAFAKTVKSLFAPRRIPGVILCSEVA